MLTHLDHISIAVSDLEAAQRDMIALLGLTPCWRAGHPEHGALNVIFRLHNTCIELRAAEAPGPAADAISERLDTKGEGIFELYLETEDIDAAGRSLAKDGMQLEAPAGGLSQDGPSGAWRRFKTLPLPEEESGGIRLSLIENLSLSEEMPLSLPIGEEDSVVGALDHVVVMTKNPDRACTLYGDRLGIRLALDKTFEERGARILFFRLGGTTIEIGASLAPAVEAEPDHLWGLAYQVRNADLARERLIGAGFDVSDVRTGFKPGTRVFTVKNRNHGVATLVIEPSTPS